MEGVWHRKLRHESGLLHLSGRDVILFRLDGKNKVIALDVFEVFTLYSLSRCPIDPLLVRLCFNLRFCL